MYSPKQAVRVSTSAIALLVFGSTSIATSGETIVWDPDNTSGGTTPGVTLRQIVPIYSNSSKPDSLAPTDGATNNNTVTIVSGQIAGDAHAAAPTLTSADSNRLTMTGGVVEGNVFGTSSKETTTLSNTQVSIAGGTTEVKGNVYGATSKGDITNTTVTINEAKTGSITGAGYGPNTADSNGEHTNTTVIVTGAQTGDITGSKSYGNGQITKTNVSVTNSTAGQIKAVDSNKGDVDTTTITISGTSAQHVFGVQTSQGSIKGTSIDVTGGSSDLLIGARAVKGNIENTTAVISGTDADSLRIADGSTNYSTIKNTRLNITDGTFGDAIIAIGEQVYETNVLLEGSVIGHSFTAVNSDGIADKTNVHLIGITQTSDVGGVSGVTANGGTVSDTVLGIEASSIAGQIVGAGGQRTTTIDNTTLSITKNTSVNGDAIGAWGFYYDIAQSISNTSVYIDGSTIDGSAIGVQNSRTTDTTNLMIVGSTVGSAIGVQLKKSGTTAQGTTVSVTENSIVEGDVSGIFFDADSHTSSATNTVLNIANSSIAGNVVGVSHSATGRWGTSATGTIVNIEDSHISGSVYGSSTPNNMSDIVNATVSIKGTTTIDGGLYGGYYSGSESYTRDAYSGNILDLHTKLRSSTGEALAGAGNFETYNFHLEEDIYVGDTMLSVSEPVDMDIDTSAKSEVNVASVSVNSTLQTGDGVILIDNAQGTNLSELEGDQIVAEKGLFRLETYTIVIDEDNNNAIIACKGQEADCIDPNITPGPGPDPNPDPLPDPGDPDFNEKANAVTGGFNAGYVSTLDATLFAATEGIGAFLKEPKGDYVPFAITGGRKTSYDNGQNINLEGFNFITGVGASREVANGYLHLAGFAETGLQSYDASSFGVFGKGNVDYMGAGIMARLDLFGGSYFEALWRTGMTDMSYDTKNFASPVNYDFSSLYTGGYAGLGFSKELNDRWTIGVHSKYIYTWLDDNKATLAGDLVRFKDAQSHTVRLATSASYAFNDKITPYGSVSYDYTKGSEIDATVNDVVSLRNWDIDGGTGSAQLGVNIALPESRWTADVNASAFTGVRKGFASNISVKALF